MVFKRLTAALVAIALVLAACSTPVVLQVTSFSPTDGATGVAIDAVVTATFNVAIEVDTVEGNFELASADGAVTGELAYDAATRTATFTPDAPLAYSTLYTVTVDGSVATTGGVTLGGDASWTFTTEADPIVDAIGGLDVAPATAGLLVGGTVQLDAEPTDVVGTPDLGVTWSSDDETVATVSADGLVTAVAEGTAVVTATSDFDASVSGSATITVSPVPAIASVSVEPATSIAAVGSTVQLTADVVAIGGADSGVTWSSDDEAVATVDAAGEVTAVAPGSATITATSTFDASVTGTADIEVATPLEPVGIEDGGVIVGYIADVDAGLPLDPALPSPFTGGVAPFTFAVVTPADSPFVLQGLPVGTTLDPDTGVLSGTPSIARYYNFAVEATDAIGQTAVAYGQVEIFLVFELASSTYTYDNTSAPVTIVPASDVQIVGADPAEDFTFTLTLLDTVPAGGVATDWSIDTPTGAITYDVAGDALVWNFEVTVVDEVTGATATFPVTFEPPVLLP